LKELPKLDNLKNLIYLSTRNTNIKSLPINIIKCLQLQQYIYKDNYISYDKIYKKEFHFYKENDNIPELVNYIIKKYYYYPIMTYTNNIYISIK
jgi:hypothetical protein